MDEDEDDGWKMEPEEAILQRRIITSLTTYG